MAVVAWSASVPVAASVKKAESNPVAAALVGSQEAVRTGVMRRLSSLLRTGTRPAEVMVEERKVGMFRRVSSRVPVAGAVRGVTGAATGWGSVGSGGGAAVVLRRRGVEGVDTNRVRPDRMLRAMDDGIRLN